MSIWGDLFGVPSSSAQPAGSSAVDRAGRSYNSMSTGLAQNLKEVRGGCVGGYIGNNGLEIYQKAQSQGANSYELDRLASELLGR